MTLRKIKGTGLPSQPRPLSERQGFRYKAELIIRCPRCGVRCANTDTLSIHRMFCTGVAPV
jgi:hypothetical protein